MKRVLLYPVMILAAIWFTGCTVVVHEERRHPRKPDVICVPADVVIEEINAAGKLSFEPHRRDAYMRIAKRPNLHDAAQEHLVNSVFNNMSFEPWKRDVLMALISNPCFSPAGRQTILTQLDRLSFEPYRRDILEAISRR
ncbi:MAG: hypothetical protein OEW48_01870 [Phycisphaerae bacterium]|nr:hypothetical protein [Phycisphaerae bacterium]